MFLKQACITCQPTCSDQGGMAAQADDVLAYARSNYYHAPPTCNHLELVRVWGRLLKITTAKCNDWEITGKWCKLNQTANIIKGVTRRVGLYLVKYKCISCQAMQYLFYYTYIYKLLLRF